MDRSFCFSLSCRPRSEVLRRRLAPCWPGGALRFSTPHFGEKQRSPLRNSFSPCRRQIRQTGPLYLAIDGSLDSAALRRPAAVVRDRGNDPDAGDHQDGGLKGPNGSLTPAARAAHEDLYL